ncbi:hypothetical protein IQ07DRAFT_639770 [Pyrenochaeta sp. DS3sAY3a]|nr:hypothetical protein IQ07DRAFT_639770 [Pyrenochaeta sp. DS3sAY3a]
MPRTTFQNSDPNLGLSSASESDSDLDTDLDTPSDTDTESGKEQDVDNSLYEAELDSDAEEIMGNIARFREQGPARPKHTKQTKKLWKRESAFWEGYSKTIEEYTGLSSEYLLRKCDPSVYKSYLSWRKKKTRITKESAIEAYWKRLSMYYHNLVGYAMGNDVLKDVRNWIPSLGLDRTRKEKLAMFVQDLYAILHALWVDDTKPLHGFIRIQISLLLLLSAATGTRPGALVESASNRGTNKALCFKDVQLMKVRSLEDPTKSTIVANVNLEHVKNKSKNGTMKKFTFRLEGLPALCIVSHILGIACGRSAFQDNFTSVKQIFDLAIPAQRNVLRIKWKREVLDQPFFCNVLKTSEGGRVLKDKAFPYSKYRDIFVRLGRVAGFEASLELYQLRRASGSNINSAFTTAERNQIMDQSGDTYERYYTPTHIARDFQAIYFGTPSEEQLIRSVASMGLSRDRRAPIELNDDQQREVRNNPVLVALRQERETYKKKLNKQGFHPLSKAKGTCLYDKYKQKNKEIASTYQQLHRVRLKEVIRAFHDSIDTIEIARQLSGKAAAEVLTLPPVEFELRERATIAAMLFKTIESDKARITFVRMLNRLCWLEETRRPRAVKRAEPTSDFVPFEDLGRSPTKKLKSLVPGSEGCPRVDSSSLIVILEPGIPKRGDIVEIECSNLYPTEPPYPLCLFCMGNEQYSYEQRMKQRSRKDVLSKHVASHLRNDKYQGGEFNCPHPSCSQKLYDGMHFKRHALDVHKIIH